MTKNIALKTHLLINSDRKQSKAFYQSLKMKGSLVCNNPVSIAKYLKRAA
jgi:hypothetical protein|tara:strand:+ start:9336 stop:9485 length:150 start_codon:yes stop_codon:yes gene_type:complete